MKHYSTLLMLLLLSSCVRAPLKSVYDSMRLSEQTPVLSDDLSYKSLRSSLQENIDFLTKNNTKKVLQFGPKTVTVNEYVLELQKLLKKTEGMDFDGFQRVLKQNFNFYEAYGGDDWGEVMITSYYEPVIRGSLKPTKKHSHPIYTVPKDLVFVDLNDFSQKFPQLEAIKKIIVENNLKTHKLKGRLVKGANSTKILPYYNREGIIDNNGPMASTSEVLAWVDPVDAFFIQIQGSGTVVFSKNKFKGKSKHIRVGYAGQNGHPYVAIGKFLLDIIPKEQMSMQKIERHLRSLPKDEMLKLLNKNPSYVFFRKLNTKPITAMGAEVIKGRTIATDKSMFPKGAIAYLEFEKPQFENKKSIEPKFWVKSSRFVIDQDTGGAIRGGGRVDLFSGRGRRAKQFAGVMKNQGRLYYLVPKNSGVFAVNWDQ